MNLLNRYEKQLKDEIDKFGCHCNRRECGYCCGGAVSCTVGGSVGIGVYYLYGIMCSPYSCGMLLLAPILVLGGGLSAAAIAGGVFLCGSAIFCIYCPSMLLCDPNKDYQIVNSSFLPEFIAELNRQFPESKFVPRMKVNTYEIGKLLSENIQSIRHNRIKIFKDTTRDIVPVNVEIENKGEGLGFKS